MDVKIKYAKYLKIKKKLQLTLVEIFVMCCLTDLCEIYVQKRVNDGLWKLQRNIINWRGIIEYLTE